MKLIRAVVVIVLFLICAVSSRAQPAALQQLQNNQLNAQQQAFLPGLRAGTNAPELYTGENADIGPQHILRMNPQPKYFEVFLDSQVYYSDNPTYAPAPNQVGSFVFVNTIQFAVAPSPMDLGPGKIAPSIGIASQWYNYQNNTIASLDFDAQTVFAGTKYSIGNWVTILNFNFTRLMDQKYYIETYNEFLPSLAAQRYFVINDKWLLALGDQVDYHVTDAQTFPGQNTDLSDHFDNIVFVTLNWQVTPHLAVQPFYRFQYSYYPRNSIDTGNRSDCLNAMGLTMIYNFNQYISARAFVNFNTMHSTDPTNLSYKELNGGVGGSLDFRF